METPPRIVRRTSILFVCMGNICRSPTAEGVFRGAIQQKQVQDRFVVESAGTHGYHIGSPPDERAIAHAARRGYDLAQLRARPVVSEDFDKFDFILAMDNVNLRHLKSMSPSRCQHKLELLLNYGHEYAGAEVPDPYYGTPKDFEQALTMIEDGCQGLLEFLISRSGVRA
jgi:protein-tyrosine phosphatase